MYETKASANSLTVSNEFSASGTYVYEAVDPIPSIAPREAEINAVYGYIRAIRALGRTGINTSEIAAALSLPMSTVNQAVSSLRSQGVRII
jgi:predicted transcriptional regulator